MSPTLCEEVVVICKIQDLRSSKYFSHEFRGSFFVLRSALSDDYFVYLSLQVGE